MSNAVRPRTNVGKTERALSIFAGSLLTFLSLKKRNWLSLPGLAVGGSMIYRGVSGFCPLYKKMDVNRALTPIQNDLAADVGEIRIEESIAIMKPREELYRFWRNFENLPLFMEHLKAVKVLDDRRSKWTAVAPLHASASWEAEIIDEMENTRIGWKSVRGLIDCSGSVEFIDLPAGRGTEIWVRLYYAPPLGKLGHLFAKAFADDPSSAIRSDLRRLRAYLETGEIPISEGRPQKFAKLPGEKMLESQTPLSERIAS